MADETFEKNMDGPYRTMPVGTPVTMTLGTDQTTPDYSGGIESFLRQPQNAQDAQQLLAGLQNFLRTVGSQIAPALKAKVDSQIQALTQYNATGTYTAPAGASTTTSGGGAYGTKANTDKAYLTDQIKAAFAKKGVSNPSQSDIDYWVNKASTPEMYSDGKVRVGWNPYWETRLITGQASADPGLAGEEGVLDPTQYANLYQSQGGGGGMTLGDFGNMANLPGRPAIQYPGQVTANLPSAPSVQPATPGTVNIGPRPEVTPMQGGATLPTRPDITAPRQTMATLGQRPEIAAQGGSAILPTTPVAYTAPSFAYGQELPTFEAPTPESLASDPGYQFRLQQGQQALEQSAAAKGTLRGGATLKALQEYAQNMASQEYQNAYARSLQEYQNKVAAQQTGYGQALGAYQANLQPGQFGASLAQQQYGTQVSAALQNQQLQNQAQQLAQQLVQQGYSTDAANAIANQQLANQAAQYYTGLQQSAYGQDVSNLLQNQQLQNQANQFYQSLVQQGYSTDVANALANQQMANQQAQYYTGAGLNLYGQQSSNAIANQQMANQANQFYNSLIQQGYNQDVANMLTNQQMANQVAQFGAGYGLSSAAQGFNNQLSMAQLGLQAAQLYGNYAGQYGQGMYGSQQNLGNIGAGQAVYGANPWINWMSNFPASMQSWYDYKYPGTPQTPKPVTTPTSTPQGRG